MYPVTNCEVMLVMLAPVTYDLFVILLYRIWLQPVKGGLGNDKHLWVIYLISESISAAETCKWNDYLQCSAGRYTGSHRIPVCIFIMIWIFNIPPYRYSITQCLERCSAGKCFFGRMVGAGTALLGLVTAQGRLSASPPPTEVNKLNPTVISVSY